ncbi:two-component response regulator ORR21-like [Lycium ferocissimum]|uniref:two-component response regulator ORR21-like n=1 Tax=Lycium ferocissimum TaxID=112874 RepID=UPI0028152763|nr:two-component response regulator ORR21-like [Lycium ferocissimum]
MVECLLDGGNENQKALEEYLETSLQIGLMSKDKDPPWAFEQNQEEFSNAQYEKIMPMLCIDAVTTVDMASTAMRILSKGKQKIDVMIVNVHSPDLLSFQLLTQAVALDIVSLASQNNYAVTCDEHDEFLAKKALEDGAYLYLKKPLDEEIVQYLWQFALREKIKREKSRERLEENEDHTNVGDADDIGDNNIVVDEEQAGEKNIRNTEEQSNKYKLRIKRGRKRAKQINEGESQSSAINKIVRRKVCTKWTVDLHAKFMDAMQQLGDGRCYPKEILEVMNVPGLTRMQVASHLQKCRSNNWRAPKERKSIRKPSGQGSSSGSQQRRGFRRFGTMPRLQTSVPNMQQHQRNPDQTQRGPEFSFPTINTNNIFTRGESSTQQHLYHPQLHIQPHYLNIDNPFNNPFLLPQNNASGELQQQHGSLFGMSGSQGLQGPIIGSTNYRSGLAFNIEDHHTQNDYNLDLNVAHVTTYSGSAIMSDTSIRNATINELGAVNANFQQYIGEPNMSNSSNIIATSHASDTEGSDSNERENYDAYFDFNNMGYLFQNLGPPSANLPNEHDSEIDQVFDRLVVMAVLPGSAANYTCRTDCEVTLSANYSLVDVFPLSKDATDFHDQNGADGVVLIEKRVNHN